MAIEDFANGKPVFAPEIFFGGHTKSWGVIETRGGAPDEVFQSEADGYRPSGNGLTLRQHFTFGDGKIIDRHWRVVKIDEHHYEGMANDVIGTAHGEAYGNVFHWIYTLALTPGNPFKNVTMDQWMYLQEDGTLTNRAAIRKLGITVATVTEHFQRVSDQPYVPEDY